MFHYELEEVLKFQASELDTLSKKELVYYFDKAQKEIERLQSTLKMCINSLQSISECKHPGSNIQSKIAKVALQEIRDKHD